MHYYRTICRHNLCTFSRHFLAKKAVSPTSLLGCMYADNLNGIIPASPITLVHGIEWHCNRLNCMVLHSISWYHMLFHCIPFLLTNYFDIYHFWELLKSRSLLSIRSISIYRGRQKNFQEREVFMYFSLIPTNSNVQPWMKIKQNICLSKFSSLRQNQLYQELY